MTTALARAEAALLVLLVACTIAALAGYAIFGLHPQLIGSSVGVARTYALAMVGFPRLHIALGFLAVAACLTRGMRRRWVASVAALYPASLACELLGTSVGWPFGAYRYTEALGTKWFGLVPLLIPLSWCTMAIVAFAIARRLLGVRGRLTTVLTGALLLIAWDLALDPAMSRLTPYWVWADVGPYFGMPWLNLAGWFATGLLLHTILFALRAQRWVDLLAPPTMRVLLAIFAANLALPVGMTIVAGIPLAAAASLSVLGAVVVLARLRRPSVATHAVRLVARAGAPR
jgi:putative membrane protein